MKVPEIERATTMADKACAAVIERPTDIDAREKLFDMLAAIANSTFVEREDKRPAYLQGLLRQACILAENARRLIDDSRGCTPRADFFATHITRAARELRRVLADILSQVGSGGNV